jgi:hypothetical protein
MGCLIPGMLIGLVIKYINCQLKKKKFLKKKTKIVTNNSQELKIKNQLLSKKETQNRNWPQNSSYTGSSSSKKIKFKFKFSGLNM